MTTPATHARVAPIPELTSVTSDVGSRSPDVRPSKRKKVSLACESCRHRKVKCDGARPSCHQCTARGSGSACIYAASAASWDYGREAYIEQLETRVRALERTESVANRPPASSIRFEGTSPASVPTAVNHEPTRSAINEQQGQEAVAPLLPCCEQPRCGSSRPQEETELPPDYPSAEHREPQVIEGYIGRSNPHQFMADVQNVVAARRPPYPGTATSRTVSRLSDLGTLSRGRKPVPSEEELVLPPRNVADALVENYFDEHWIFYPVLDPSSFRAAYEALWSPVDGALPVPEHRIMFHCVLNLVFAISAQTIGTVSVADRRARSYRFFARGKSLLQFDMFEGWSFELVQALILCSQYMQSEDASQQCWTIIGIAVRLSQYLGLHVQSTSSSLHDPRERELARCVWHSLLVLETAISASLGRPPFTRQSLADPVSLPKLCASAYKSNMAPCPCDACQFFSLRIGLSDILRDIVWLHYGQPHDEFGSGESFLRSLGKVFEVDNRLHEWRQAIPDSLRVDDSVSQSDPSDRPQRLGRVIYQWYLFVQIILNRSSLPLVLHSEAASSSPRYSRLQRSVASQCALHGIKCARSLISLIHRFMTSTGSGEPMSPWWTSVYYTHTAATLIAAAQMNPKFEQTVGLDEIRESVKQYQEILRNYQPLSHTASKCLIALQRMMAWKDNTAGHPSTAPDEHGIHHAPADGYGFDGPYPRQEATGPETNPPSMLAREDSHAPAAAESISGLWEDDMMMALQTQGWIDNNWITQMSWLGPVEDYDLVVP